MPKKVSTRKFKVKATKKGDITVKSKSRKEGTIPRQYDVKVDEKSGILTVKIKNRLSFMKKKQGGARHARQAPQVRQAMLKARALLAKRGR